MTSVPPVSPADTSSTPSNAELVELMSSFNEVTSRLEQTHLALRSEVRRLSDELSDTKSQLARAQELAALGEMAAGIAHEVRNPLGSIRLYAEALVSDLGDRPEERSIASRIVSSVTGLNAIVGDVLAFSRELRIDHESIDPAELIEQSVSACAEAASDAGVSVRVERAGALVFMGDAGLLRQALVNILRNAIEAASEGESEREVRLSAEATTIRNADGSRVDATAITVSDTGPGIPVEVRERMFNPFFTTRETGTGLGLAIVHRILDAHGGRVAIPKSTSGTPGATVALVLPTNPSTQTMPDQDAPAISDDAPPRGRPAAA